MRGLLLILTAAIGCGGSQHGTTDPAARAREAERKRIEAMKPASPYEVRAVQGYRAPTTCGQGPYRIDVAALGARFGEQLEINICAPRSLQGDYRLTRGTDKGEPRHFGSINNSEYCRATAAEAAQHGGATTAAESAQHGGATTAGSSGGASSSGASSSGASSGRASSSGASAGRASSSGASSSASALSSTAAIALTPVTGTFGETCPQGMYLTGIVDFSSEMGSGDGVPWKVGTPLVLELWSAEPLHLDGATFVVIQRGVRADMTVERWTSYREAKDRWTEIWNAYLEGEVTAGRAEYADMNARTDAPPPARVDIKPPRPSLHAEWIAGYWQRDREWIWSPGFWRVPESDIVAEQTIEAPVAPPPMKSEAPPVAPVAQPQVKPATPPPAPTETSTASTAPTATATVSVGTSIATSSASTATAPASTVAPVAPPSGSVNLVWTPGYWSWNGSAYVWIEGAWRIPPQGGARWVPPTWTSRRGRFVLVPGGWSVRIGR